MKLYFVRHSEVIEKYKGCYNGHIDVPLSEKGKEDAKELAKKLAHIHFDRAFCSDLLRAKQTIDMFDLDCDIVYTPHLREKSWGRHEGMRFEEIVAEGLQYKNFEQWIADLDGEPFREYLARINKYFHTTLLKQNAQNILVVTHAGVIKTLLSLYNHLSLEEAFSMPLSYSDYICYDTMQKRFLQKSEQKAFLV